MEALNTLANMNPGNPTGDPQASAGSNRALWDYVGRAQEGGRQADQALGGWPGTVGDYMNEIATTPGVGYIAGGAIPPSWGLGTNSAAGATGGFGGVKGQPPTGQLSIMDLFKSRPDLKQWYDSADPTKKAPILEFLQRSYLGREPLVRQ